MLRRHVRGLSRACREGLGAAVRRPASSGTEGAPGTLKITNAGAVVTASTDGRDVVELRGHDVFVRDGAVVAVAPGIATPAEHTLDANGGLVTPAFVDPHTHLFPPADRAHEFALRSVRSYQEIAAAGGGILSSVRAVRASSEEEIVAANRPFLEQFVAQGTLTVEAKSGYGLSVADELKALQALRRLQDEFRDRLTIVPTFMGAHAVPPEHKGATQRYVDAVCTEMIPEVARLGLAEYCDVFCEAGYFSAAQAEQILRAGLAAGLLPRIHADEFVDSGGAAVAAAVGAHSADHLMAISPAGIAALAGSLHAAGGPVVPTVLPGTTLFLGKGHRFAPARALLAAGCPVAVATDFNPGSSVYQSQPLMMQLCMSQGGMTLKEAFLAATHNAALALRRAGRVGTLQPGADADLVVWQLDELAQIPYFGVASQHRISAVVKRGRVHPHPGARLSQAFVERRRRDRRAFSSTSSSSSSSSSSSASPSASSFDTSPAAAARVARALESYVRVDRGGRIEWVDPTIRWDAPPALLDPSLDHAPVRRADLTPAEREVAITNVLKYFAPALHDVVRRASEAELARYGHVYLFHLLPPTPLFAIPSTSIPAARLEARAMIHMILNNLDPRVAQFPQELVTYGGNGCAFSNWAQFWITTHLLRTMSDRQTLNMYSGHPQGLFPRAPTSMAPFAVITNGMMVPNYSTRAHLDRLFAMTVSQYGQMTAGSWMYIGPQGIVHGTTLTLAQAVKIQARRDAKNANTSANTSTGAAAGSAGATTDPGNAAGRVFVTSGLGGMSGAQPKAATINGAVCLVAEVNERALRKRQAQGWLDESFTDLDALLRRAKQAQDAREAVSLGYVGNVVDLWEALARTPRAARPRVHVGSDQTSLHNPYNGGYYPVGMTFEESQAMMRDNPAEFQTRVQTSLRRHLAAVEAVRAADGMYFFDYGNAFLLECHRAGAPVPADLTSYVEGIMGPEYFDFGFGPYRWVCTSGDPRDLATTDAIAADVLRRQMSRADARILPQLRANLDWIEHAAANNLVVGSQARILYSDTVGRVECAVQMNRALADGRLRAPVVIGRDHHDVSGTDSPWRETANIHDGSNITADMAVHNVIGDACRGATWVSLHNGGGTGWGEAINGGFGLVLDGSEDSERRARSMIFFDVANGLVRRARAGNPNAVWAVRELTQIEPDFRPFLPSTA